MAALSRTGQFTRLHKILKKYYSPVAPDPQRSVLEHLLFASLLENASYAAAEEAFASLVHTFFDWNEIRVSSVRELSEVVAGLPDPSTAVHHVKRILQSLFEATYSFDLEELRKQNLGPAVERLEKTDGTTRFAVSYLIQVALGGHSIPVDSGTLRVLVLVGLISEGDAGAGVVPGLERAIPKSAGVEFGSLLHQLGADFVASPYSPASQEILLEIDPGVKARLPRRRDAKSLALIPSAAPERRKKAQRRPEAEKEPQGTEEAKAKVQETAVQAERQPASAPARDAAAKVKRKPVAPKKKSDEETGPRQAPPRDSAPDASVEPLEERGASVGKKKPALAKKPPPKKPADPPKTDSGPDAGPQEPGVEGLSKRKPR